MTLCVLCACPLVCVAARACTSCANTDCLVFLGFSSSRPATACCTGQARFRALVRPEPGLAGTSSTLVPGLVLQALQEGASVHWRRAWVILMLLCSESFPHPPFARGSPTLNRRIVEPTLFSNAALKKYNDDILVFIASVRTPPCYLTCYMLP